MMQWTKTEDQDNDGKDDENKLCVIHAWKQILIKIPIL